MMPAHHASGIESRSMFRFEMKRRDGVAHTYERSELVKCDQFPLGPQ